MQKNRRSENVLKANKKKNKIIIEQQHSSHDKRETSLLEDEIDENVKDNNSTSLFENMQFSDENDNLNIDTSKNGYINL